MEKVWRIVWGLCLLGVLFCRTEAAEKVETVTVPVPLIALTEKGAGDAKGGPGPTLKIKGANGAEVLVPMKMEATLLRRKAESSITGEPWLELQSGKQGRILLSPDWSVVDRAALGEVREAELVLMLAKNFDNQLGTGQLDLYAMVTPWLASVSWLKPDAGSITRWMGLRSGKDYNEPALAHCDLLSKSGALVLRGSELTAWVVQTLRNTQSSQGLALTLSGEDGSVRLQSSQAAKVTSSSWIKLSAGAHTVEIQADPTLIERLALQANNLKKIDLIVGLAKPVPGAEFKLVGDTECVGVMQSSGAVHFSGVETLWNEALKRSEKARPVTLMLQITTPTELSLAQATPKAITKGPSRLEVTIANQPKATLFTYAQRPAPGEYVQVKDGHLTYQGKRLRLWGAVGHENRSPEFAARLRQMGFNGYRMWTTRGFYTEESARKGEFAPSTQGDDSPMDRYDLAVSRLKAEGIFIMCPVVITSSSPGAKENPGLTGMVAAGSYLDDGSPDYKEWSEAVRQAGRKLMYYRFFDGRLQEASRRHLANFMAHRNPYTGKTYAEEESIFMYEFDNENGFLKWIFEQGFAQWHPYFIRQVRKQWNAWLIGRYGSTAALAKAWDGLDNGEEVTVGTVKLAPLLAGAKSYSEERQRDLVRFFSEKVDTYYQGMRQFAKKQAPEGVGAAVVPYSFDTLYRPNLAWTHAVQKGDVHNFGIYLGPSKSVLDAPPSLYVLDQNTVKGKPAILYETNQSRVAPNRSEFAFRLAALGSWEDWDAIFFHYWDEFERDPHQSVPPERYLVAPLRLNSRGDTNLDHGIKHDTDPVMCASLGLAGQIFRSFALAAATRPAVHSFGPTAYYSFKYMNGVDMSADTFTRGAVLAFNEQQKEERLVDGQSPSVTPDTTKAVAMGREILWDWPNSRLVIDAPRAKVFIGPWSASSYIFRDGSVLSGIGQRWLTFAMVSTGMGVNSASTLLGGHWVIGALRDARNTGYHVDWSAIAGKNFVNPKDWVDAIRDVGRAPIMVDQVNYTLSFPRQFDGIVASVDFSGREIYKGKIGGDNTVCLASPDVWLSQLSIEKWGEAAKPRVDIAAVDKSVAASVLEQSVDSTVRTTGGIWHPLPGLTWEMSLENCQRLLEQNQSLKKRAVANQTIEGTYDRQIQISETNAVLESIADVTVLFRAGKMVQVDVLFLAPPSFRDAVAAYESKFGAATEKSFANNAFEFQKARWRVASRNAGEPELLISMDEHQGSFSVRYTIN